MSQSPLTPQEHPVLDMLRCLAVNLALSDLPTFSWDDIETLGKQLTRQLQDLGPGVLCGSLDPIVSDFIRAVRLPVEGDATADGRLQNHLLHPQITDAFERKNAYVIPPRAVTFLNPSPVATQLLLNHTAIRRVADRVGARVVLTCLDDLWASFYFTHGQLFALYRLYWGVQALFEEGILLPIQSRTLFAKLKSRFLPRAYLIPSRALYDHWQAIAVDVETARTDSTDFSDWLRRLFRVFPRLIEFGHMLWLSNADIHYPLHPWFFNGEFAYRFRLDNGSDRAENLSLLRRLKHDQFEAVVDFSHLYRRPELPVEVIGAFCVKALRDRGHRAAVRELDGFYRSHLCFPLVTRAKIAFLLNELKYVPDDGCTNLSNLAEQTFRRVIEPLSDGFAIATSVLRRGVEASTKPLMESLDKIPTNVDSLRSAIEGSIILAAGHSRTKLIPPDVFVGLQWGGYRIGCRGSEKDLTISFDGPSLLFSDVLSGYRSYVEQVIEAIRASIEATARPEKAAVSEPKDLELRFQCGKDKRHLVIWVRGDLVQNVLIRESSRSGREATEDLMTVAMTILAVLRLRMKQEAMNIDPTGEFAFATGKPGEVLKLTFAD